MLSDLSFIDLAALLIAVALLIVTAIAAYLSHANLGAVANSTSSEPLEYQRFPSRPPAHAASDREPSFKAPPPPIIRRSQPPLIHKRSTPPVAETDAPAPKTIDLTNGNNTSDTIAERQPETVAERAARLRQARSESQAKRSESKHSVSTHGAPKHSAVKRPVSESKVIHKTTSAGLIQPLTFAGSNSKLSAGMDTTITGFSVRPPGFFEDPIGRHEQRYWDGSGWTEHCKAGEDRFTDPL